MANRPVRDDLFSPSLLRTFTSFAAQKKLDTTDAPPNAQSLPCQLIVQVGVADQHLDLTDSGGTACVLTFPAVGTYVLRISPLTIETTTTVAGVTVCWNPAARV